LPEAIDLMAQRGKKGLRLGKFRGFVTATGVGMKVVKANRISLGGDGI